MATQHNIHDFTGGIVDRLGDIKAQIAELKAVEADLVARLIDAEQDVVEGRYYRAAIVHTAESTSLDAKAAEAKLRELGVDGRWFAKHQKVRKGSVSVRVSARKS